MGQRIAKHIYNSTGTTWEKSTYYVRDAQGNVIATYEKTNPGTASMLVKERDIYGSSRVGMYTKMVEMIGAPTPSTTAFKHETGSRQYELSNHLGNVLAVITDRKRPLDLGDCDVSGDGINDSNTPTGVPDNRVDFYQAEIVAANDYSPFGVTLDLNDRSFIVGSTPYKYGFNGMEKDNEIKPGGGTADGNSYDFGARLYDSRLGRFLSIDAMAKNHSQISTYCYAANIPIAGFDNGDSLIVIAKTLEDAKWMIDELQIGTNSKLSYKTSKIEVINSKDQTQKTYEYQLRITGLVPNKKDDAVYREAQNVVSTVITHKQKGIMRAEYSKDLKTDALDHMGAVYYPKSNTMMVSDKVIHGERFVHKMGEGVQTFGSDSQPFYITEDHKTETYSSGEIVLHDIYHMYQDFSGVLKFYEQKMNEFVSAAVKNGTYEDKTNEFGGNGYGYMPQTIMETFLENAAIDFVNRLRSKIETANQDSAPRPQQVHQNEARKISGDSY